jgi:hypothetical protein
LGSKIIPFWASKQRRFDPFIINFFKKQKEKRKKKKEKRKKKILKNKRGMGGGEEIGGGSSHPLSQKWVEPQPGTYRLSRPKGCLRSHQ